MESDDSKQQEQEDICEDNPEEVKCDWIVCEPSLCQRLARPSCLLVWLCLCSFTQGMIVNGFVNSVLTTLELRFDLQSVESGLIASSYDIGSVLCLIPVTYIGRRYRRSRLISVGALVMGLGSFIFSLPHFTTGLYSYESPVPPLCYPGGTFPSFCTSVVLNNYKWVFWLGQFLHGIGSSPFYTLAVAYLDDNLTVQQSGAFLGVYYMMSLLGPAMGYLLGGMFLNIYVDIGYTPTDISPSNTNLWVGAWWLGFVVSGALSLVVVVPMFGFPKSFRGSERIRRQRRHESHANSEEKCATLEMGLKDFLPSVKVIMSNPTFVFLSLTGAADGILVAGLSTFGPKMLQTLFYMTSSSSTLTIGLVSVPSAAVGLLVGGLVIRFTDLSVKRLLWMCVVVSGLGMLVGFAFLLRCDGQTFAGVNANYKLTPNQPQNLTASCNSNCGCQANKFLFSPLCGADNVIYYSPCHAGCQLNATTIASTKYYANCSCISGQILADGSNFSAVAGACKDNCNKAGPMLGLIGLFMFAVFFISIPTLQCTMRVIPPMLKDFGLGLQWIILRCLGSIPGPLLLGRLIDTTCSLWTGGCGSIGSCSFYDNYNFFVLLITFTFVLKGLELLLLLLSVCLYKPPDQQQQQKPSETELREEAVSDSACHENKAFQEENQQRQQK